MARTNPINRVLEKPRAEGIGDANGEKDAEHPSLASSRAFPKDGRNEQNDKYLKPFLLMQSGEEEK